MKGKCLNFSRIRENFVTFHVQYWNRGNIEVHFATKHGLKGKQDCKKSRDVKNEKIYSSHTVIPREQKVLFLLFQILLVGFMKLSNVKRFRLHPNYLFPFIPPVQYESILFLMLDKIASVSVSVHVQIAEDPTLTWYKFHFVSQTWFKFPCLKPL